MIKVGLIGLGYIGTTVGREIDDAEGAEVVALSEVHNPTLDEGGELFNIGPDGRYERYLEMFEHESLDAVLVGTPHTLHYDQVVDALDRGLHVLCEKPLTTDLERAAGLVRLVKESAGTLTVGYQRRLQSTYLEARARIDEQLSTPTFITAEITQNWIDRHRDSWRGDPRLSGGGQLYDTGSHLVDSVLWMTGLTPKSVSASMVFDDEDEQVDIHATVNVEFAEGAVASISVSGDTPETREHIHVWGDEGAVYIHGEGFGSRDIETIGLSERNSADLPDASRSKGEAFVEAIQNGHRPFATAREAMTVTMLTEAAYESARTGNRIDVEPEDPVSAVSEEPSMSGG